MKTRIFVIRNGDYGTYVHTSMTKIKAFTTCKKGVLF